MSQALRIALISEHASPMATLGSGDAGAIGGILYSVLDGVTGYLVPPRDPAALAARLAHLHAHPALAAALGRAGIQRVRTMFTWDRIAADLADVYRAVVGRRAVPQRRAALVPLALGARA